MGEPELVQQAVKKPARKSGNKIIFVIVTVVLCVAASVTGTWLLLATGLVHLDVGQTIAQNREKIVLQQGEIVADVFKKVNPSTVAITTQGTANFGFRFAQQFQGAGSGIIISKDGYILTNKHVVPEGTKSVTVVLADGKQYENVQIVGRDPMNDIAFLKIDGVNNLTAAQLGDSDKVQPGQQVVAIGNALGIFRNSVSAGIISGLGRPIQAQDEDGSSAEQLEDLLQTDAAINPGNSGGPLVDLAGQVIGINTAVSEEGQAIGFAIPISNVKKVIDSMLKTGKIVKPYLGVHYVSLDPDVSYQLHVKETSGALVLGGSDQPGVVLGSPAAKAGIREGDVITKINDSAVDIGHSLAGRLAQFSPNDTISVTFIRNDKPQTVKVTLTDYPQ